MEIAMPTRDDMRWFKQKFQTRIAPALAGTPLTIDLIVAIACQETGFIWSKLRRDGLTAARILELCVGDVIDAKADGKGRRAFPKNRADLLTHPQGTAMFAIARQALLDMAAHIPGFNSAVGNTVKFCRGYGLFQRDLQFFRDDPQYFLQQRYARFDDTLAMCIGELKRGLRKLGFEHRPRLSDEELTRIAIVYNTGTFRASKGLKQGHFDGAEFYGERVFEFIRLSKTVAIEGHIPILPTPTPGEAIIPPPSAPTATGPFFRVDTRSDTLRLRSEPRKSAPSTANVKANLPDGHPVRAITGTPIGDFMEVETSLMGALLRGFAATEFLVRNESAEPIPVVVASPRPPQRGFIAAHVTPPAGKIVKRRSIAGAHSLNETGRPSRTGRDPDTLRRELAAIIDWLACDDPNHLRFKPRDGLTFCNIYAHDYCDLAGIYLPRVWWSEAALIRIAQGQAIQPLIGNTVREMRADDIFFWLRDFGPHFGWRQTGTASKLQLEVNQGAVGLIIAERKQNGRSGHVVMVVPETILHNAKRNAAAEVTAPLQSQAGVVNFRYGTSKVDWWKDEKFSDAAFWLHA
jgi:hypothetical protein